MNKPFSININGWVYEGNLGGNLTCLGMKEGGLMGPDTEEEVAQLESRGITVIKSQQQQNRKEE